MLNNADAFSAASGSGEARWSKRAGTRVACGNHDTSGGCSCCATPGSAITGSPTHSTCGRVRPGCDC
eukprot:scaffold20325_cov130-Isochrysis_galbana.AAC.10